MFFNRKSVIIKAKLSYKELKMTDTYQTLICPACGKAMKKVFLEDQGFIVDVCLDGCGGIWFDNRELKEVDEKDDNILELTEAYKGKTFSKVDKSDTRECPLCHKKMVKNCVSAKQEISIDECYTCGGKFLDYNELEQMRAQYDTEAERIEDIKEIAKDSVKMELILESILRKDKF